jgi:hypothetical protein
LFLLLALWTIPSAAIANLLNLNRRATDTTRFIFARINVKKILEIAIGSIGSYVVTNRGSEIVNCSIQDIFQCSEKLIGFGNR